MNLVVTELEMPVAVAGKARRRAVAQNRVWAIGEQQILHRPLLAFFASTRCPGDVILRVYDAARSLRDAGIPIISGFHTPMEKECLDLLLRGIQPVVICPARSLQGMRVPSAWKPAILAGRLLLASPFAERHRRNTAELAGPRIRRGAIGGVLVGRVLLDPPLAVLANDLIANPAFVLAQEILRSRPDRSLADAYPDLVRTMIERHEVVSLHKNRQRWCWLKDDVVFKDDLQEMRVGFHSFRLPQLYSLCRDLRLNRKEFKEFRNGR